MMSTVVQIVAEISDALADTDLTVKDHLPDQIHPPLAVIEPADPYIEDAGSSGYGAWSVSHDIWLIAEGGTHEATTSSIRDRLLMVITALDEAGIEIASVRAPFFLQVTQAKKLPATVITVTATTHNLT